MINFLYCGMAADVLLPFNLTEDIDVLYSISLEDKAFNGDSLINNLITKLSFGKDEFYNLELKKPCKNVKIISINNIRYEIGFNYLNKDRKIIYYINRNFYLEWPQEIKDINHLSSIGASFGYLYPSLNNSLHTRCTKDCIYYEQWEFAPKSELIRPLYNLGNRNIFTYNLSSILNQKEYHDKFHDEGIIV